MSSEEEDCGSEATARKIFSLKKKLEKLLASWQAEDNDRSTRKIVKSLKKLDAVALTLDLLRETKVGKVVNKLSKLEGEVGERAKFLVVKWKNVAQQGESSQQVTPEKSHEWKRTDDCNDACGEGETSQCSISFEDALNPSPTSGGRSRSPQKQKSSAAAGSSTQTPPNGHAGKIVSSSPLCTEYKPCTLNFLDVPDRLSLPKKKVPKHVDVEVFSSKCNRTPVFSGKKTMQTHVPRLFDCAMRVLVENRKMLEFTGGVPAHVLWPVLEKCNVEELFRLEDYNPYLAEDEETDALWKAHAARDFKSASPNECESWRELYLRLHDEREQRLRNITARVSASMAKAVPVRQTMLASAKAPRSVLRQQMKHGTARTATVAVPALARNKPQDKEALKRRVGTEIFHTKSPKERQPKVQKRIAPLMAKTLKMAKMCQRR